jgi:hypothetical protein
MKLRLLIRAWVQIVTAFIVLIVVMAAYGAYAENRGEKQARDFCASVPIGSATAGLVEKAAEAKAQPYMNRWYPGRNEYENDRLSVTFTGFLLSRHKCIIEASKSKVVVTRYLYID